MTDIEMLEQQANAVQEQISKLNDEYSAICTKIHEYHHGKLLEQFDAWQIEPGRQFVLFAKSPGAYHWTIAQTVQIHEVNKFRNHISTDCIVTKYRESDDTYYASTCLERFDPTDLMEIGDKFNVYIVEPEVFTKVQHAFLNLEINSQNYQVHADYVAENTLRHLEFKHE